MLPANLTPPAQPNFSLPPPKLRSLLPNEETSWAFSENVAMRLQQCSNPNYSICEVRNCDPEWQFIFQYFSAWQPTGKFIGKAYCIQNDNQKVRFERHIDLTEEQAKEPFFASRWRQEGDHNPLREKVINRWNDLVAPFSPCILPNEQKKQIVHTKVIPLWHGTKEAKCQSILKTGFAIPGKHLPKMQGQHDPNITDFGFFGSGIYFTTNPDYAAHSAYSDGNLFLCWVSISKEPYPVVADKKYSKAYFDEDELPSDMKKLQRMPGYHAHNGHYIPVISLQPTNPRCANFFPCTADEDPVWDEIVVFDPSQALVSFWIQLEPVMLVNPSIIIDNLLDRIKFLLTTKTVQQEPHLYHLLKHKLQSIESIHLAKRTFEIADRAFYQQSIQILDLQNKINFFVQDFLENIYDPDRLLQTAVKTTCVESSDVGTIPGVYIYAICENESCSKHPLGEWIHYECDLGEEIDFSLTYGPGGVKCSDPGCKKEFAKHSILDKVAFLECAGKIKYRAAKKYGDKEIPLSVVYEKNKAHIVSWRLDSVDYVIIKKK